MKLIPLAFLSVLTMVVHAVAATATPHVDDPAGLLAVDGGATLEAKLAAFEASSGITILVRFHATSPTADEDKVPGAYMKALSARLGTAERGVLCVHFADEPDWRIWVGDELASRFVAQPGTAGSLTANGAIHASKEALFRDTVAMAPKESGVAGQAQALVDGLFERFTRPPMPAFGSKIDLWPEGVPGLRADAAPENDDGKGHYTSIHFPSLVVYPPPAGTANGTAVIYAPGGGYQRVSSGVNGGIVTEWLNSLGITVYMLKYRHNIYPHPAPLQDALRAVRLLRSTADELGIKHLGMLGGSAGGHLTASAGTLYDAPEGRTGAALDAVSGRPDFMVLIFPMISMRETRVVPGRRNPLLGEDPTDELRRHLSVDEQVTKDTPPAFIVHSAEDRALVEGSVAFSTAMRKAGAPVELHLYTKGPHGDGMSPKLGPISEWPKLCEKWMRFNGWLPPAPADD